MEVHRGTKIHDSKRAKKRQIRRSRWCRPIHAVTLEPISRPMPCMSLHWPIYRGTTERTRKPEFLLALSLRCKLGQRQLYWVGVGILLSKDSTLLFSHLQELDRKSVVTGLWIKRTPPPTHQPMSMEKVSGRAFHPLTVQPPL